ncbi:MAG: hypothetical protein E5X53_27010 [Mesorhizobium sp.]|uniref:hypothetical protein n=1 Tax=Mesorhizobium sp. TaxID=1871066 RepID=UPI00121D8AA2|nr:hypothetical protein [Mesorhizobium sp.]TIP72040.1 MAG: hypothetical protein E5X55_19715 [Mesorhizobium sp.]TIR48892.1 MAG: hypothetical protein E5X53_27010 [Mesorhizobium sp.]TJV96743.1 MAG: hypothetical protein E5X52_17005 [Mesorhizobium sp.]
MPATTLARDLLYIEQWQFDHFANAEGEIECDITSKLVAYADANVSHANPSFSTIVNGYRKFKGWEVEFAVGTPCCALLPNRNPLEAKPCRCR